MSSSKRPGKEAAAEALRAQADAIRNQETPTPSGEPHRIVNPKPVTAVLEAMKALDDDELGFLFDVLDAGMHDEWDCTLPSGLEMFGPVEIRIAVKTAAIFASTAESEGK